MCLSIDRLRVCELPASHEEWASLFDQIKRDDHVQKILYDSPNSEPSFEEFKNILNRSLPFVVYYDKEPLFAVWLTAFKRTTAEIHFTGFRRDDLSRDIKVALAKHVIEEIFLVCNDKLRPHNALLTNVCGFIPTPNQKAINFALKVGFRSLGVLPDSVIWKGSLSNLEVLQLPYKEVRQWEETPLNFLTR